MTSSDQQATGKSRSDAIDLVENAFRSGRIVQADRDMRVDQLKNARTMQDVEMVVRDLQAVPSPAVPAGAAVSAAPQQPWPLVNYGPGTPHAAAAADVGAAVAKGGRAIGGIIAVIVLISVIVPVAGAIIAFVNSRDSLPSFGGSGPTDETTYLPGQAPGEDGVNVHTVDGFTELVDALREETDQTYAYSAVLYPRYAVLDVPTGTNDRYQSFYWDGRELELSVSKGTSTDEELDLAAIDPQMVIDLLETVRGRVEAPESWYVIISHRGGAETQISGYASNDFGETAYQVQTLDGTVVYQSSPGDPA